MERQQSFAKNVNEDPNFDRKLDLITAGASPYIKDHLLHRITRENCLVIINYILAMQTEANPSESYRINTVYKLNLLAEHFHPRPFNALTRQDVLDYLNQFRKPESVDPLHKWVGTYELSRIILLRFFRWLYYPDQEERSRPKPQIMLNIPRVRRKEISIYKPTDLWTEEDDALFHKYCPSVRDRCWHAVSRDTGCRPSELLKLKIKDIVVQQLENGYQIARITVNGKTGTRHVRLNNSYPRLKDWLSNGHPYPANPNAPLFCGTGKKNTGKKIARNTIYTIYDIYKKERFPKLLDDPTVPEEDKRKIRDLLKKPWNPYIRRHTAATEISKALKDSVLIDQYMGWTHSGNTRQKYQHYYNDDSFDAMLTMMDGLKPIAPARNRTLLKPRLCPNCSETNTPESRFCSKCKFVLTFDAFNEVTQESEKTKQQMESMQHQFEELQKKQNKMQEVMNRGIAYMINYDMQGITYEQVLEQLASQFEEAVKESEERERTGRKLKIKEGFAPVDFKTETIKEFISTVKERRQQSKNKKR